jgi:ABC-type polysaccharide/polyol phosphate export permease
MEAHLGTAHAERAGARAGIGMVGRIAADIGEMVQEQIEYRELTFQMAYRDLLLRYKQTAMGFAWAVFMPLVNTLVFSFVFMRAAPIDTGMPYPLYAFCGLLAWNFTASSLRFALISLTSNLSLVTKVYFPREIFPVSAVLISVVDLAVASLVLVGALVYYQIEPQWTLLFLPLVVAVHIIFTMSIALLLAMANLFYRDVKYLFEIAITVWMFLTSVVYPVERLGGRVGELMQWNPMTPIVDAYRDVLIRGEFQVAGHFAAAAILSIALLLVSWLTFHRAEFKFAERA